MSLCFSCYQVSEKYLHPGSSPASEKLQKKYFGTYFKSFRFDELGEGHKNSVKTRTTLLNIENIFI